MADVLHDVMVIDAELNNHLIKNDALTPVIDEAMLEKLKEDYFNQGYEQGKIQGITEGEAIEKKRALAESAQQNAQLTSIMEQIPQQITEQRMQLNHEIASIVLTIIQQFFVQRQLDQSWVFTQVNQMLTQLNQNQQVELFLHPIDIKKLHEEQIQLHTQHLSQLKICPDQNLDLGGCHIKTCHGLFDASIEKQIEKLKEILIKIRSGETRV